MDLRLCVILWTGLSFNMPLSGQPLGGLRALWLLMAALLLLNVLLPSNGLAIGGLRALWHLMAALLLMPSNGLASDRSWACRGSSEVFVFLRWRHWQRCCCSPGDLLRSVLGCFGDFCRLSCASPLGPRLQLGQRLAANGRCCLCCL
jgi:hypothetical protein